MSRYDGLIIPRSYSEYINKTDAATLLQALQLSGVMDNAPTANSNHPTKSSGVYTALAGKQATLTFDNAPTANSNNPVKSGGIYTAIQYLNFIKEITAGMYTSFLQIPKGVYSISDGVYRNYTDAPQGVNGRAIFIAGATGTTSDEQIALLLTAQYGDLYIGNCYGGTPRYTWKKIT